VTKSEIYSHSQLESHRRREKAMVRDALRVIQPHSEEELRASEQSGRTEAYRVANAERLAAKEPK